MKETENKNTDTDREGGYTDMTEDIDRELRERRRQRRLRRQKRERRKKLMILGATGIITLVVVAGAVNGIAGFIRHSGTQSDIFCERDTEERRFTGSPGGAAGTKCNGAGEASGRAV